MMTPASTGAHTFNLFSTNAPEVIRLINTTLVTSEYTSSFTSNLVITVNNYGVLTETVTPDATVTFLFPIAT